MLDSVSRLSQTMAQSGEHKMVSLVVGTGSYYTPDIAFRTFENHGPATPVKITLPPRVDQITLIEKKRKKPEQVSSVCVRAQTPLGLPFVPSSLSAIHGSGRNICSLMHIQISHV